MKVDDSFIVLDADWTCAHALEVLAPFEDLHHVIVHRADPDDRELVWAYAYREVVEKLRQQPAARVLEVLHLDESTATPIVHADGGAPEGVAVVVDRGRFAGVGEPGAGVPIAADGLRGDRGIHGVDAVRGIEDRDAGHDAKPRELTARAPSKIQAGQKAWLFVTIGAIGNAIGDGGAMIAAAIGDQIDLVLDVSGSVAAVPPSELSITIDSPAEIVKRFQLEGSEVGIGRVVVRAFQGPSQIAAITVTIEVVPAGAAISPATERRARIQQVESPPDLDIVIEEDRRRREYRITLTAAKSQLGLNRVRFGPIRLDRDVDDFFTRFYAGIEKIVTSTGSAKEKLSELGQQGVYLYERIVPQDMRERLWQVRDAIATVRIQSEEPWVPWELCKLSGKDTAGTVIEDRFIAERYAATRWFLAVPELRSLSMSAIGLVVPPDSGLPAAPAERSRVEALQAAQRTVTTIRSQAAELREQLASGTYDVLHFVGHGAYDAADADHSSIKLEHGARLLPRDLAGRVANFGKRNPLVVLNACQVGRSGTTLGGLAGWPQAFIRAGAAAFIGPLWKVDDGSASEFSGELYDALLAGKSIGEAVQHARSVIRAAEDPTWLAYVAYAHPDAKITA